MWSVLRLLCLIIAATVSVVDAADFDDWTKSAVEILSDPMLATPAPILVDSASVRIHNGHGQQYHCHLPSDSGVLQEPSGPDSSHGRNISHFMDQLLSENECLRLRLQWWTYEVCSRRRVRQYHERGESGAETDHSLGLYVSETGWTPAAVSAASSSVSRRYHSEFFSGGSVCDLTGERRSAEVRYGCFVGADGGGEGVEGRGSGRQRVVDVTEPRSCHYVISVLVPKLCHHWLLGSAAFRPPLLVTCRPLLSPPQLKQLATARADRVHLLLQKAAARLDLLRCNDTTSRVLSLSCVQHLTRFLSHYISVAAGIQNLTETVAVGLPQLPDDVHLHLTSVYQEVETLVDNMSQPPSDVLHQLIGVYPEVQTEDTASSRKLCPRVLAAAASALVAANSTLAALKRQLVNNSSADEVWNLAELYQWLLDADKNSSKLLKTTERIDVLCRLTGRNSARILSAGRGSVARLSNKEAFFRMLSRLYSHPEPTATFRLQTVSEAQQRLVMHALRRKMQTVGVLTDLDREVSVHVLSSDGRAATSEINADSTLGDEVVLSSEEMTAFERLLSRVLLGGSGVYDKHLQHAKMTENYRFSVEQAVRKMKRYPVDEEWSNDVDKEEA